MANYRGYIRMDVSEDKVGFHVVPTNDIQLPGEADHEVVMFVPPTPEVTEEKLREFFRNSTKVLQDMDDGALVAVATRLAGWFFSLPEHLTAEKHWRVDDMYIELDGDEWLVSTKWFSLKGDEGDDEPPMPIRGYIAELIDERVIAYVTIAISRMWTKLANDINESGPLFGTSGVDWIDKPVFFDESKDGKVIARSDGFKPIETDVKFTDKFAALSGLLKHRVLSDSSKPAPSSLKDDLPF